MSDTPAVVPSDATIADLLQTGDVSTLAPEQRGRYLSKLCETFGLNPFSRPFDFITVKGQDGKARTILYANRVASDQLRFNHHIESEVVYAGPLRIGDLIRQDVYCVELDMKLPLPDDSGPKYRVERAVGCVGIGTYQGDKPILLTGEAMANAIMKCYTKALRRGTLSIVGLGFPDETEVADIPSARTSQVDTQPLPRVLVPDVVGEPLSANVSAPAPIAYPRPLPAAKPPTR